MDFIISNLFGLVIGLLTSFFTWWTLFHLIVPQISFADFLSKLPTVDEKTGWRYRFMFTNTGRRALIDVQVRARISITGLTSRTTTSNFDVALDWSEERKSEIPIIEPKHSKNLRLFINLTPAFRQSALIPNVVREKSNAQSLLLEELLDIGHKATITIFVFGYDSFSGARKLFISKPYSRLDIHPIDFKNRRKARTKSLGAI